MGSSRVAKKDSLYDKTDKKLQRMSKTVGAVIVLIGAASGICAWVSNQFQNVISEQISAFQEETRAANARQEQSITRVELLTLMTQDPENKAAIEKMARYYFKSLDGDLWMTSRYSSWAKAYGGDITIIVGVD